MYGNLIGDIVGSTFESENHRSKYFEFFRSDCRFTDDSVIIYSIYNLLNQYNSSEDFLVESPSTIAIKLKSLLLPFLNRGFGNLMYSWLTTNNLSPFHSSGNGSLLRVFPVFKYTIDKSMSTVQSVSLLNNVLAINYLEPNNDTILLFEVLKNVYESGSLEQKLSIINKSLNNLIENRKVPNILSELPNDLTSSTALYVSLLAISQSNSFEDSLRTVISYGGDSDTFATITGGISELIWDIPEEFKNSIHKFIRAFDKELFININ